MTPAQQSALAQLAGRALDAAELAALAPLVQARNDVAVAALLSVGRVVIEPREIGVGTILAVLGGEWLDQLATLGDADRTVYWAMELIRQGRLDIGMAETRARVTALAALQPGLAEGLHQLLALAEVAAPLHHAAVSAALEAAA
ncbi:hypothetical protein GPA19_08035 [Azoarcus indigens]|uniref:Uncharacterized protein n=1 Tax=Azoarcus indigens TaxID=29545 RepID=A0A4R6DYM0_9RHOO|nr:hypothetical protein [Azoarcus indigens]NMG64893.1 hypothetical protein [Azoarcus indigens]TDN50431.1 hypothetical protein C7389_109125 [Azoarcus indigens]